MTGKAKRSGVAALCVDAKGPYPQLVEEWYDLERDARRYRGPWPVVAHPPCGPWGALKGLCTRQDRDLGLDMVAKVRRYGGVLEHPAFSSLWAVAEMSRPGEFPDAWGGVSFEVTLWQFGAEVKKRTWLYVVGCKRWPSIPYRPGRPRKKVAEQWSNERAITPVPMAAWLLELAAGCEVYEHDEQASLDRPGVANGEAVRGSGAAPNVPGCDLRANGALLEADHAGIGSQ